MPLNMSFALTIDQVRNKTKTVTRRQGWSKLKVGDTLQPIEKGMGLKKGEKVKKIGGLVKIINVKSVPICGISKSDVEKEGFPNMLASEFVRMYCKANKAKPSDYCNRIVFEYL